MESVVLLLLLPKFGVVSVDRGGRIHLLCHSFQSISFGQEHPLLSIQLLLLVFLFYLAKSFLVKLFF